MNNKNITVVLFVSAILLLTFCKHIPDFPLQPVIKFNSISMIKSGSTIQGLRLELDFTDGDGDLGLNSEDTSAPYNPMNDKFKNPQNDNFYNYFYTFLIQDTDSLFKECKDIPDCNETIITSKYTITDTILKDTNINGVQGKYLIISQKDTTVNETLDQVFKRASKARYPYLRPDSKKSPLSGTLTYDILIPEYIQKKKIKLGSVYIKDRALNNSNQIETDTLTIR